MSKKVKVCRRCGAEFNANGFNCYDCKAERDAHFRQVAKRKAKAKRIERRRRIEKADFVLRNRYPELNVEIHAVSDDSHRKEGSYWFYNWRVELHHESGVTSVAHSTSIEAATDKAAERLIVELPQI